MLRELHEHHPEILIELDTSQEVRDLGAGEADISLRSTKGADQPAGLVGRSSASTIGRSIAAATMPRGTVSRGPLPS